MPEEIQAKLIEEEMKEAYVDYAMSVIVSRALPDVRDGLKPVHRRILYAMSRLNLLHNRPFRKSATVVGNVMSRFHPHGDQAIYDTLVRLAQGFSLRYPLIDGQGNFGSVDGDNAAAMRYTESRLSKISEEILSDIDKDTVDFIPNYDGSSKEPTILPAKLPNLLINGTSGIAVGMATNIPPHNISEIIQALLLLIKNPESSIQDLMDHIKGPDFPTGAFISGVNGIKQAYATGRGRVVIKAKTNIEEVKGRKRIVVTEIPYQVNKALMIESIADLIKEKRLDGISDIRDESDRKGMRVVFELKKGADENIVLNQLFKNSQLRTTFGVNMLALVNNQPRVMNIKDILQHYLNHRKIVVTRRTQFELDKAEKRAHILEGLRTALMNIDSVIALIKASNNPESAKNDLIKAYSLSDMQASAILDMRLQRLTSLEQDNINKEYRDLINLIKNLKDVLSSDEKILGIIKDELNYLQKQFGDERRTNILDQEEEVIEIEDLVPEQDVIITMTSSGYVKRLPLNTYKRQRRGGKGIIGTELKEEDAVEHIFITSTHNHILCFSNKGKVYWLKGFQIPEGSRYSKGKAIVNLLNLKNDERITALLPVSKFSESQFLLMATKNGMLKKTNLLSYSRPRKGGIIAINLKENDELISVRLTPGVLDIILATKKGRAVKFNERNVPSVGRSASGVRGVKLQKNDAVVGMEVALNSGTLLTITENGFGKRTPIPEYRLIRRGGKGVINIKTSSRNGDVVSVKTLKDDDEIVLISSKGIVIRVSASDISTIGRNTSGVRIMKLNQEDSIRTVARVVENDKD